MISEEKQPTNDTWLTPDEVAIQFNKTGRTVRNWIKLGYFPSARLSGPHVKSGYLIPQADIDKFVERLKNEIK